MLAAIDWGSSSSARLRRRSIVLRWVKDSRQLGPHYTARADKRGRLRTLQGGDFLRAPKYTSFFRNDISSFLCKFLGLPVACKLLDLNSMP